MGWIFLLVAFGLGGIIIEICLAYSREATEIGNEQVQTQENNQSHLLGLERIRNVIGDLTTNISELKKIVAALKKKTAAARTQLAESTKLERSRRPTRHKLQEAQ